MTRKQAIHKILRILKDWEGSRLEYRTAKEVLDVVEKEIGMKPPKDGPYPYSTHDWTPARKSK